MQINQKAIDNFTWLNIQNPEKDYLKKVLTDNNISTSILENLISPLLRSQTETLDNCLYIALHFPIKHSNSLQHVEVDFLIKENLIISVHYTDFVFLSDYVTNLNNNYKDGMHFAYFINYLYKQIEKDLDSIFGEINMIEKEIFSGNERKTIEHISMTRRKLFDFESAIRFHKEVLETFAASAMNLFGREYATYGDMIVNDYFRIWNTIEHQKNMLLDLKDTNDFLINNKTNELIKSFTVISYIILPLTLISGFLGMNVTFPSAITQNPFAPILILIFLTIIGMIIINYIIKKKWL